MVAEKTQKKKQNNKAKAYPYQYETSPKKLQPNDKQKKQATISKKTTKIKSSKVNNAKYDYKPIIYIITGFVMLFTICYRNSLINEIYNKKESLKEQLAEVQKENEQLKVNIESNLNLNAIEKIASEQLGMKKLTNEQKVYVNLQKKDYVEPATEEIVIDKETSIIDKILNALTKVIK